MRQAAGLIFVLVCFHITLCAQTLKTEVLVVGGSTGGTAAGIQSARMGVKTIIVEPTPWLGGMLSAAGVSCTDGNHLLPSGIWQEFREALYAHYRTRNLFTGWVSETCFEPAVGDSILKSLAAKESNLTVMHGWYFDKVIKTGNKVIGAIFINRDGKKLQVNATLSIDGTDLGDVFADAGAGFDLGMEDPSYSKEKMAPGKNDIIQDLTWAAILKDYGAGTDHTIPRPPNYDSTRYFCSCSDAPCPNGKPYKVDAQKMLEYGRLPNNKFMLNWPAHGNDWYINVANIKQIDREKALEAARQNTLGFIYFIQTQLGKKHIGLYNEFGSKDGLALMPYHREGRRIKGKVRMNINHLTQPFNQPQKLYRTGIAVGDYPVDHHHAPEKNAPDIDFPKVPSFNIALGALIPNNIEGLIVCEKGISVSNIVNGSSRLQPCVLLTGQAGGILAALAIQQKKSVSQISVRAVQKVLLKRKAYLLPYIDVQPNSIYWESIQRVGVTGILKGVGVPEGWANKTFFYPDSMITDQELAIGLYEFENKFPKQKYLSEKQLTISAAWGMLVEMQHHYRLRLRIPHKYPSVVAAEWKLVFKEKLGLENVDGERLVTRKELAVMVDALAQNPFEREVDLGGGFR